MSSPSRRVLLSPKARQDFIDILRYTGETWGERQLQIYRQKIDEALQLVGRDPNVGRHSDDLPKSMRLYVVGSHVLVYRVDDTSVGIARILHQRMHLHRHTPRY